MCERAAAHRAFSMPKTNQRNAPCFCGALLNGKPLKYKRCHGRPALSGKSAPGSRAPTPTGERVVIDWMSGFMEDHIRPVQELLYGEFVKTWCSIYDQWASDAVHDTAPYDTFKCERWAAIAEEHLRNGASTWDRRLLLKAARTFPLRVLGVLLKTWDEDELTRIVRLASLAIIRFSPPGATVVTESGQQHTQCTETELERMKETLGPTLARIFAGAFALATAQDLYRWTGKGKRFHLPRQSPAPIQDAYPMSAIVLLPGPVLEPNEEVDRSVELYETRKRGFGASLTGLPATDAPNASADAANWWAIAVPMDRFFPHRVTVRYRKLALTIHSSSYVACPMAEVGAIQALEGFADQFPRCFGLTLEQFFEVTRGITRLIYEQTGYYALRDGSNPAEFAFDSDIEMRPAVGFLYDLFSQGMVRNSRSAFLRALGEHCSLGSREDCEAVVHRFMERFTWNCASFDPRVRPHLFYEVDANTLVLDCLAMPSFFDFCLAEVTSGDGAVGNRRGTRFEEQVRGMLCEALGLAPADLPVSPNRAMKFDGRDYGDVDFAFY